VSADCIHADRAIKAIDFLEVPQETIERHRAPQYTRWNNGARTKERSDAMITRAHSSLPPSKSG